MGGQAKHPHCPERQNLSTVKSGHVKGIRYAVKEWMRHTFLVSLHLSRSDWSRSACNSFRALSVVDLNLLDIVCTRIRRSGDRGVLGSGTPFTSSHSSQRVLILNVFDQPSLSLL